VFSLVQGSAISPKIRFLNEIGWSDWSFVALPAYQMQDVPHAPTTFPFRQEQYTADTQMGVGFQALAGLATGGSIIVSYNLQMDSTGGGSGPFVDIKGFTTDDLSTEVIINNQVKGKIYFFRYRAKNAHGWGAFSPVNFVRMANKPS